MRTDDMNLVKNGILSLVSLIRNMPFTGSREQIQISQIIFLDKYYRDYITYEVGLIDVENAKINYNYQLYNTLKDKYSYAYDGIGIFREKRVGDMALAETSSEILRRLGIQCNVVKGALITKNMDKEYIYPHQWNEIKLGDKWYCYDFTLNLISEKWKDKDIKPALKFIKMPVTAVDYSFVKQLGKNVKIGGYMDNKFNNEDLNPKLLTDDFSKYSNMDRFIVVSEYAKIDKLSKLMNMSNNNDNSLNKSL